MIPETKAKNPHVPDHIPSVVTVEAILAECVDLRAVLPKSAVRTLAEYATTESEKHELMFISSRQVRCITSYMRETHFSKSTLNAMKIPYTKYALSIVPTSEFFPVCNADRCYPRLCVRHTWVRRNPL